MSSQNYSIIYWDSSSLLSVLFEDSNSVKAHNSIRQEGAHLISTLAYAEVYAVAYRIQREQIITGNFIKAALLTIEQGPWRYLSMLPDRKTMLTLAQKWSLRGADLWHLATAKTLQKQIPELILLSFDNRLVRAAKGENMIAD